MPILVLGSQEVVAAFALGGMRGRAVGGRGELLRALDQAAGEGPGTILVIEEATGELAREEIDAIKLDPGAPLVVEVAGPAGALEMRKSARDLVRRALGIRI